MSDTEETQEAPEVDNINSFDLDNMPKVEHHWVQRGIKVSCEGASHPTHSHFLVKR